MSIQLKTYEIAYTLFFLQDPSKPTHEEVPSSTKKGATTEVATAPPKPTSDRRLREEKNPSAATYGSSAAAAADPAVRRRDRRSLSREPTASPQEEAHTSSGVSSSNEMPSAVSKKPQNIGSAFYCVFCYVLQNKVGQEIQRFQREIERLAQKRSKLQEWTVSKRSSSAGGAKAGGVCGGRGISHMGSMDSLLSAADSDYSSGRSAAAAQTTSTLASSASSTAKRSYPTARPSLLSQQQHTSPPPPALPPRGRFVSSEDVRLVPPPRPPTQKKRVSISAREAEVITTPMLDRKRAEAKKEATIAETKSDIAVQEVKREEEDKKEVDVSNNGDVAVEVEPTTTVISGESCPQSDDSLATLPSVKELATKFMPPRKSPEPTPRKSVHKAVGKQNSIPLKTRFDTDFLLCRRKLPMRSSVERRRTGAISRYVPRSIEFLLKWQDFKPSTVFLELFLCPSLNQSCIWLLTTTNEFLYLQ